MKVAVIGNMNNNGFALMRYFRDLGVDSHLFLYKNDGIGSSSNFVISADTWHVNKWKECIHGIDIENSLKSLQYPYILRLIGIVKMLNKNRYMINKEAIYAVADNNIKKALSDYDYIICSGSAPGVLHRLKIKVDIFYPYSTGVEYLGNVDIITKRKSLKRLYTYLALRQQLRGLKKTRIILNSEMSISKQVLNKYGLSFLPVAIPMVYNREEISDIIYSSRFKSICQDIKKYDFTIISHARQMWVKPDSINDNCWFESKHNDWLIKAFSCLLQLRPLLNAKLILFEYGKDIDATKTLITTLGIDKYIMWLSPMNRKEIIELLKICSVGVGEFRTVDNIIWGGTGWEVLSVGKPLLQSFNFNDEEYYKIYGYMPPPMLRVKTEVDVLSHLIDIADNPKKGKEIGRNAKDWFNKNNGIGLAKKWLDLMIEKDLSVIDYKVI